MELDRSRQVLADRIASRPQWIVGMMSGTSLDGVDAALVRTDGVTVSEFGDWLTMPYEPEQIRVIERATRDAVRWNFKGVEPESFKPAQHIVTMAHARACQELLARAAVPVLVGFHGQTVVHRVPDAGARGATRQLGDGALLAEMLSLPVVYDFRGHDMARGGQGAPLAPVYHVCLLRELVPSGPAAFVNIGGVANITFVSGSDEVIAFDTGPGNGPIDQWMQIHGGARFDRDGTTASGGRVDDKRLTEALNDPYFALVPPKSLDRSYFSPHLAAGLSLADGAATLTALSACSILSALDLLPEPPQAVVVTGGGLHNQTLMAALRSGLGRVLTDTPPSVRPDAVEAEAFAYLAARSVRLLPLSHPGTTGVEAPTTGGILVCR